MEAGTRHSSPALTAGAATADLRVGLAQAVGDVCAVAGVATGVLFAVHDGRAAALSAHGAPAPAPWALAEVPLAAAALREGETQVVVRRDDPRLTATHRRLLSGDEAAVTLAVVPLMADGAAVGLLTLADRRPRDLSTLPTRLRPLLGLCAAVVVALARADEAARENEHLLLLLDTGGGGRRRDGELTLRLLAGRLGEAVGARAALIYELRREGPRLVGTWATRADAALDLDLGHWLATLPTLRAALRGRRAPLMLQSSDEAVDPDVRQALRAAGLTALELVPLPSGDEVAGLAALLDPVGDRSQREEEHLRLLARVAAGAVISLSRAERARRSEQQLREVARLGTRAAAARDPRELAQFVCQRLVDALEATCCEVYMVQDGVMRCLASIDVRPGYDDPEADRPLEVSRFPSLLTAARDQEPLVFATPDDVRLTDYERTMLQRWGFRSELTLPLVHEGELIGLIDVFDTRPRDYAEQLDFARLSAQLVAAAFAKSLLLERVVTSNADLRLLVETSLELGSSLQLDRVVQEVATRMRAVVDAACCDIYAVEGDTIVGLASAERDGLDHDFPGTTYPLADFSLANRAIELETPLYARDVRTDPRLTEAERAENLRFGFASLLELPLINRGQVVGVASLFDHEPRDFDRLELLRGLGQVAAQAIANAGLVAELDAHARRLETVNATGLELVSTLDLQAVLEATARRLCEVADVDCCDIYVLDGEELRCEASVQDDAVDTTWLGTRCSLAEWRGARLAVESRAALVVASPGDARLGEAERAAMRAYGQKSGLIVPLIVEQRAIGVAELFETRRERGFCDADVALVEAVSRVAALAIANAGLFRDLERRDRESRLLSDLAVAVTASLDPAAIAAATVEHLATMLSFDDACLLLPQDGGRRVVWTSAPAFADFVQGRDDLAAAEVAGRLATEAACCLAATATAAHPARRAADSQTWQGLCFVAATTDDGLGALVLGSRSPRPPEPPAGILRQVSVLLSLALANARLYQTIRSMHVSNLAALISALNARDAYAVGHAARVAAYIYLLGRELGWPDDVLRPATEVAFLHDVGRVGVGDDVLFKPGHLTQAEADELRRHPLTSADILAPLYPEEYVAAVRHHHERWDGDGYPDGLAGERIPLLARALAVVDAYDAMCFDRPHHQARSYAESLAELDRCRGTQFDPDLVPAFMRVLDRLDERRSTAKGIALAIARTLDAAALAAVARRGMDATAEYAGVRDALRRGRDRHTPESGTVAVAVLAPGPGGWRVLCDAEEDPAARADEDALPAWPGLDAGPGAGGPDRNVLHLDRHGVWVTAYAPVTDRAGQVVAVVAASLPPTDDWPAGMPGAAGFPGPSREEPAFAAVLASATARLGKARVDAVTDGLTGLYNQRHFKQRLAEEVSRALDHGRQVSLLFCDLDRFKQYNDRFGHVAGDEALRAFAEVVRNSIRQVDVAARYGGEELTVILVDTPPAAAAEVAERIRAGVAALDLGTGRRLTVSIGAATCPDDATSVEELLDKADWAMYLAKRDGRDRVVTYGGDAHD